MKSWVVSYIGVGHRHWKADSRINFKPQAIFQFLLKKDVGVISSMEVDDFEIEVIGLEEQSSVLELGKESPEEEDDLKKAA